MKILILWSKLADYSIACFRELSLKENIDIFIVYQPSSSEAPYYKFDLEFCYKEVKDISDDKNSLVETCISFSPDVIIMASWNFSHYMRIAKLCKKRGAFVLSTFDGQWEGTLRQRIGIAISKYYLKPRIDNFLVPSERQSTFARKLGYKNPLTGFYSANSSRYHGQKATLPKNKFLFVGRLVKSKGIDILLEAYSLYRKTTDFPWVLEIAGTGPYLDKCKKHAGVKVHGFKQPHELSALFAEATCFILPSTHEPWGVVVHEAALAGCSIISSYKVGSTSWFVRDGQNGKIVYPDEKSLKNAMIYISNSSDKRLKEMSEVSHKLGCLWTTDKWADYIYDYLINAVTNKY